jgi:hypothetical protein
MDQATLRAEMLQGQAAMAAQMRQQTAAMCDGKESLAHLHQCQAAMETQMLQQTAAMREGKDSLAQLQQRLEKMEGQTKDTPHGGAEGGSGGNDDVKHSHVRDADGPEEDGSGAEPRQGQSSTPLRGLHRRQHQACRCR